MMDVDFKASEQKVWGYLRRYRDIKKHLKLEIEDRASPSIGSCLGKRSMGGGGGIGDPVWGKVMRANSPIDMIELPDQIVTREITTNGVIKIKKIKMPGCMIERPIHWIYFTDMLVDFYHDTPEGAVLWDHIIMDKDLSELVKPTGEKVTVLQGYAEKIKGAAVVLAIMHGLV